MLYDNGSDAANDAHCAIMVYKALHEMARIAEIKLDPEKYTQNVSFVNRPENMTRVSPLKKASSANGRIEETPSSVPSVLHVENVSRIQHSSSTTTSSLKKYAYSKKQAASVPSLPDKAKEGEEEEEAESSSFEIFETPKPYQRDSSRPVARGSTVSNRNVTQALNADFDTLARIKTTSVSSRARPSIPAQQMRAYKAWTKMYMQIHTQDATKDDDASGTSDVASDENGTEKQRQQLSNALDGICVQLRSREYPLKRTTVMYVRIMLITPTPII